MKKILLSAAFVFTVLLSNDALAQQGFGTNQPDKSAAVDIVSTKRGLLIPRINITDLSVADPVINPAHSLFVFNTNTSTGQGFYYWERTNPLSTTDFSGKWVSFLSSANLGDVISVEEGDNVNVDRTVLGSKTIYTVGIKAGGQDGQVMVTKVDDSDPSNVITTTQWVDPADFVYDALKEGNAISITKDATTGEITFKFSGILTENTTIATGAYDLAITGLEKLSATNFDPQTQNIVVMGNDGVLKMVSPKDLVEKTIEEGGLAAKTLTGNGITVTATGETTLTNSLANTVLADVTLGIADGAITTEKIADGAVTNNKLSGSISIDKISSGSTTEGQILISDGDGGLEFGTVASAVGKDLTTDGIIGIGTDGALSSLEDAVLVPTHLSIKSGGNSKVLTTNDTGAVTWLDQSALASTITASGDVTGALNNTKVVAIQGTGVSNTAPTATNNILKFDGTTNTWIPSQITGDDIVGEELTSNSLIITGASTTNAALLEELNLEIKPGLEGQILTTTGAVGSETTTWTTRSLATNINEDLTVADITNYNEFVQDVNIKVTIGNEDVNVTLPAATANNKGQVVNVSIANTTEAEYYLNIITNGSTLTYGSMPFQGWIIKSTGTEWVVVGRN